MTSQRHETPLHEYIEEMKDELTPKRVREALKAGRKLPAILSLEEVDLCIAAATSVRNQLIIRIFYATGVRVEELSKFLVADIGWDTETMFVRDSKYDKDRLVCIDIDTLEALREYTRKMDVAAPLFNIGTRHIRRIVVNTGKAVGLVDRYAAMGRRFSPHALRHCFATHLHENGMDVVDLKMLLGHDYLDTTEIYVEVAMKHLRDKYKQTHNFSPKRRQAAATTAPAVFRLAQETAETRSDFAAVAEKYRTCHALARAAGSWRPGRP